LNGFVTKSEFAGRERVVDDWDLDEEAAEVEDSDGEEIEGDV